jgi:hypothetical protein
MRYGSLVSFLATVTERATAHPTPTELDAFLEALWLWQNTVAFKLASARL